MSSMHYHVQVIHSQARQHDLLAEARHRALLDEAEAGRRGTPALTQARNAIGVALVRIGERLQVAPIGADSDCRPAGQFRLPHAPAR